MAVIVAYRLEFCLKLAEVGQGMGQQAESDV